MIEFVKGDFFDFPADIRINTVNCVGVMGAGVALLFKTKYPKMYEDYVRACNLGEIKIGVPQVWKDSDIFSNDQLIIINFPTKDHWRKPSEYSFIEKGLTWLHKFLSEKGSVTITVPALGCGHGGLDWKIVKEMISEKLQNLDARILVFEPASSMIKDVSDETHTSLADNGIVKLVPSDDNYPKNLKGVSAAEIYLKGDQQVFNNKIFSIIVDTKAEARERNAVLQCLEAMPQSNAFVYLLGYNSSFEIDLVKQILSKPFTKVMLVLPYGILQLKKRKDLLDFWDDSRITLISCSLPGATWKPNESLGALKLRFKIPDAVLIANFKYDILERYKAELFDIRKELFYINYWQTPITFYEGLKALQIGKNRQTHLPNVAPILSSLTQVAN